MIDPEEFEKLDTLQKAAVIAKFDNEVREWWAYCRCGKRVTGKLNELKAWRCNCGR